MNETKISIYLTKSLISHSYIFERAYSNNWTQSYSFLGKSALTVPRCAVQGNKSLRNVMVFFSGPHYWVVTNKQCPGTCRWHCNLRRVSRDSEATIPLSAILLTATKGRFKVHCWLFPHRITTHTCFLIWRRYSQKLCRTWFSLPLKVPL